ncbi:MAG: PIN domain-containing protein [Candidatus Nanohaloarchaea archaeon]
MKRKIMLDTNFLVAPFQFSFPMFDELESLYPYQELYTLKDAVEEAKSIKGGKYKKLVEQLLEVEDINVLETEGEGIVDDLLVDISDEFVVATNDKELKQRILDLGRPVIIIRQRNHLEVINRRSENL